MLQQGFTLLETLVALLILSVGLLGLAGLQLTHVKNSRDTYYRTQAVILAQDIAERMRTNRQAIQQGVYHTADGTQNTDCREAAGCSWSQLAADDTYLWHMAVVNRLPAGESAICRDSSPDDGTDADNHACDNNGAAYVAKVWWDHDLNPLTALQRLSLAFTP